MRMHSAFFFNCLCGRSIETPERAVNCPGCGRLLVIEWGTANELAQDNYRRMQKHERYLAKPEVQKQLKIARLREKFGIGGCGITKPFDCDKGLWHTIDMSYHQGIAGPGMTQVKLCHHYAAQCRDATSNPALSLMDRVGAQMGELDWMVAEQLAQEPYQEFIRSKSLTAGESGFLLALDCLHHQLFDWQKAVVRWGLRKGRAALFEGCGLGKTFQQLEWAHQVCAHTGGNVLILAPLAVAEQTVDEAAKFGIKATLCRAKSDVKPGINVTNYDMLEHFDTGSFVGVVLDESSILKSYDGSTRKLLTKAFANTTYRLCCTATPSPNDHMELGTHAEFLGIMKRTEMLATFFTHDGGDTSKWRLKGHGAKAFWKWVCSWAIMMQKPSDIGPYDDSDYKLPELVWQEHVVPLETQIESFLFTPDKLTLSERREVRVNSLAGRVKKCAEVVGRSEDQWLIWCDLNAESTALAKAIPESVEVVGSDSRQSKREAALRFINGEISDVVTKASIWGFGLNLQNCSHMAFVGLSDSFEWLYQAVRRCWRFGQKNKVYVHVVISDGDGPVLANIKRKEAEFEAMQAGMIEHMRDEMQKELGTATSGNEEYMEDERVGTGWQLLLGDCVTRVSLMPDDSVDFTIFSPPFSSLYVYSNSERDMGNSRSDAEFQEHFGFLVDELFRVTRPGRIVAFHCMNIPAMKERDGYIGIKDFRGDLIRLFQSRGFIFHSEHVIWKDPLIEATRTKAIGLMHKQLCKDSAMSRAGLPDYLIAMRKPGENTKPIQHLNGLTSFAGENPPKTGTLSHERWRRYASPVWMDIDQSNTLNARSGREKDDERHICPLQLDVIERAMELWSTEGDLVLSPFAGIGSEGYQAIRMGRRFVGVELKASYFTQAVVNLRAAEKAGKEQHGLFATEGA